MALISLDDASDSVNAESKLNIVHILSFFRHRVTLVQADI